MIVIKKIKLVLIVFLFLIIFFNFNTVVFSSELTAINEETYKLKEQINLLKQRISSLEKNNNNLLDNIKWIFGLSITIILFILGAMSWFSFRIKEEEKENIKEKLRLEQNNKLEEIEEKIEKYKSDINSLIEKELDNIKEKNEEMINKKIKYKISSLEEKIRILNVDFLRYKSKNKNGFPSMYTLRKIVEDASQVFDRKYVIGNILKEIEVKMDDEGLDLDPYDEQDLNILLKKAPKKFESQKNRIKNKLKK